MKNFNLMVSTGRNFENQAENELWFNLLALGDETPIIFRSGNQGLILAKINIDPKKLIAYLRDILKNKNKEYMQFIQKITPIDIVVSSDIEIIKDATLNLVRTNPLCQKNDSKYRISVKKRQSMLKTSEIIDAIATAIPNKVSLKEFDWNIQVEIIGDTTGIAIHSQNDIFKPISEKRIQIQI